MLELKEDGMSKLKVSFGIKYKNNISSGKHKFANRLSKYFLDNYTSDIEIVNRSEKSDVHITFDGVLKKKCVNIYRIDGIWINNNEDYARKNEVIIKGLKNSHFVIYQSEFCREAVENVFGIYKGDKCGIVYNGADPSEFVKIQTHKPKKPSFISTCKWRPHKRLKYIIKGFLNSKCHKDSILYIAGDVDKKDKIKDDNIIYLGWSEDTNRILPWCISSVYLSYLDWCPNAVVESLVAGVPVIYADSGGIPNIVKTNGISIPDIPWDFKPLPLYNDYPLDIGIIAKAYDTCFENKNSIKNFKRKDLFIKNSAKEYMTYIQKASGII